MIHVFLVILGVLAFIAIIAAAYYLIIWLFEQIGWPLPNMALKCLLIALVLLAIAWLVAALFGGGAMLVPPFR